jgi:hypothetical protein
MNLFWLLIVAAIIYLAWRRLRSASVGAPLLDATVSTTDGVVYQVEIVELLPDVKPIEYVWLALMFTAKMIYIADAERRAIINGVALLNDYLESHGWNSSRLTVAALQIGEISPHEDCEPTKHKKVTARLGLKGTGIRPIWTTIPAVPLDRQFHDSVFAVIAKVAWMSDDVHRQMLLVSLTEMGRLCENGNSSSIDVLLRYPVLAFNEASKQFMQSPS